MEQNDPILTKDKSIQIYHPRNMKYSLKTWNDDVDMNCVKQHEDLNRTIEIRDDIKRITHEHGENTRKNKVITDESIKRRTAEVDYWRQELIDVVDKLNLKNDNLRELMKRMNRFYEKLICQRDISRTCINKRNCRMGIELVRDNIDVELNREYELLEKKICQFEQINNWIIDRLKANDSILYQIRLDIVKKFHTLQIENYIHKLSHLNEAFCGIKDADFWQDQSNNYGSIPETWLKCVQELRDKALQGIEESVKLINDAHDYMDKTIQQATDHWQMVNKLLLERIIQVTEASDKLTVVLNKIIEGIASLKFENEKLNKEVNEQKKYLILAKNRLTTRSLRTDYENCDDKPNMVLREEIKAIEKKICDLEKRHKAIIDTIMSLERMRREKESDLANKNNTLHYDKSICMVMRTKWPNGPLSTYNKVE